MTQPAPNSPSPATPPVRLNVVGQPAPRVAPSPVPAGKSLHERVEHVLRLIRPAVQSDGGDVELLEVTPDGTARIKLHGACVGCPSSLLTLQVGIERNLKAHVPEVRSVVAVP